MLGSTVLEVAIGLTFCYGTVALIVTTVQEALASAVPPARQHPAGRHQEHAQRPAVSTAWRAPCMPIRWSIRTPTARWTSAPCFSRPSYIEPAHFAIALVDSLWKVPGDFIQLRSAIDAIPDPQVRRAMLACQPRGRRPAAVPGHAGRLVRQCDGAHVRRL
jgi:hypothetical protein